MLITNKTKKPLSVPLPGGKKLFLGPGKSGQVTPKALEHPPLQKLVEAEEIEVGGLDNKKGSGGGSNVSRSSGPGRHGSGGIRHTGDR